uniref:Sulfotransferase domain-containing protein n=1 Tax=Aureoumbra lagunensis TaxID=44058 RepID=A0A7S3JY04_9STRA|mmetsp:Transcript_15309/g.20274  ORF Transcript_15309/g.20274 Transcript_15309/m.20274 type:complete len:324 (+) Transcript_15309:81-1052(+)
MRVVIRRYMSILLLFSFSAAFNRSTNLVYIKLPKCASSTVGGIARRIAAHYRLRGINGTATVNLAILSNSHDDKRKYILEPQVFANHAEMSKLDLSLLRQPSFVFSLVREPSKRCISSYFYTNVHRNGANITLQSEIGSLRQCKNGLFSYLVPRGCKNVSCLFSAYDFIGTVETWDKSMVLLAHLTGVPISAVLSVEAKSNPHPPLHQPAIDYISGPSFNESNKLDIALYEQVQQRLDTLANNMGSHFNIKLNEFKEKQSRATQVCSYNVELYSLTHECKILKSKSTLHCGNIPKPWPNLEDLCYWGDNGCNYRCLDAFFGYP